MFDRGPAGVLATRGKEHRLLYMNDAFRAMFGDRQIGTPVREALHDVLDQDALALFDAALAGEATRPEETRLTVAVPGGPGERLFRMSLSGIPLDDGGLLAVFQEVTAQVAAARRIRAMERELHRLRRRYDSMVWADAHMVWVTGPDGESREVSQG
ncbi:MAG: PAS domain-containing protein [Microbispora sp.]|nr:PAS domain-containing protein [Microbispora sp.]